MTNNSPKAQRGRTLDARTFQHQLESLANTIALKVEREGVKVTKPPFTASDITVMLRHSLACYQLMLFINADETRKSGTWKPAYSAALLAVNRSMIDCFYNIAVLIRVPAKRYAFRESGYKFALDELKALEEKYRGKKKWATYIRLLRDNIRIGMDADGITMAEVNAAKTWPTLSGYLRAEKGSALTPLQGFLKRLTFVFWKEYSAMTHAVFQGLMPTAVFYMPGMVPHDLRDKFHDVVVERFVVTHVVRSAAILLCTLTEVQAEFRFFGEARINERLLGVWNALRREPDVKELYQARYEQLMRQRGIA